MNAEERLIWAVRFAQTGRRDEADERVVLYRDNLRRVRAYPSEISDGELILEFAAPASGPKACRKCGAVASRFFGGKKCCLGCGELVGVGSAF